MAHKRKICGATLLAICYLIGATWGDLSTTQNNSSISGPIPAPVPPSVVVQQAANKAVVPSSSSPAVKLADTLVKQTNSTQPQKCVCHEGGLLPRLDENGKVLEICPECKCSHQAHNTTLIKVVVIIVIWIISILVIYMLFLMCLEPLMNKRVKANYQEHTNEDDDMATASPMPGLANQELNSRANVLNRVGHQQDKWKRQVREQRRHIYDRRTMLN